MHRLGEPIGKQDQYIAAFGNVTALTLDKDGTVHVEPVPVKDEVLDELANNLVIMWSGIERAASSVLEEQGARVQRAIKPRSTACTASRPSATRCTTSWSRGHRSVRRAAARTLTNKRKLASKMTDSRIDEHYEAAREAGAIGGKLMGAGGGGFFMFYARPADKRRVYETMAKRGLRPLRFRFDSDGARIVANMHRS